LGRRSFALLGLCVFSAPRAAWAGSYLNRASLLVTQAAKDSEYLHRRVYDKDLAFVVHKVAAARVEAASAMHVPKEVAQAHPHLLLVLENHERAADAAKDGQVQRFLVYKVRAREEELTLRGVLKQLGWSLPDLDK
jgi:hypothetical protein